MKKKDNVLVRPPDTFPTIYIHHGSPPVFSYRSKPFKSGAQSFEPNAVINDSWMTNPIDAISPMAAPKPTVAPPLAEALPPPYKVFSNMEKKSKRETQTREEKAQEKSIADIPVAPVCVDADDDAPAPAVQALVSDASAGLCPPSFSPPPPPESRHSSEASRIARGLLHYKKWWFLREVGISVEGKMLTGTPIFMHEDTLRVVNDTYSYFIPMDNVDYIRTPDGLNAARVEFEENPLCAN